ncbi:P-loop containing nucleoside triphosphate hydrolase protein [Xylaria bambusicola]|uniref:P-loop containing nucleoside triphosphate hydrolase protein n=1 Tax=Xylaria bambusicola TaxID=326684 RepID=UPI0020080763|nr:P-loop containing nucleoside triphosphate hydrolase protein [Xylaria bambusicola]KAI0523794.1 P-loop containing nucleoside triphosphate hydrolase protein [Xylaria bambusicola]
MSDENQIAQELKSLKAVIYSLKNEVASAKPMFLDELRDLLSLLIREHVDGVNHHLNSLTEAVRRIPYDPRELETQLDAVLPHIEQHFRSLAEDIVSCFGNANSGHNKSHTELEKEIDLLKINNFELSLALANVRTMTDVITEQQTITPTIPDATLTQLVQTDLKLKEQDADIQKLKTEVARVGSIKESTAEQVVVVSHEANEKLKAQEKEIKKLKAEVARAGSIKESTAEQVVVVSHEANEELKAREKEIEKLKAALKLVESQKASDMTNDIENWKNAVAELEEAVKTQEETISIQQARINRQDADSLLLIKRYRDMVEELANAKGNIRVMCRVRPAQDTPDEELIHFSNPDNPDNINSMVPWSKLRVSYLDDSKRQESRDFDFQRAFGTGESNQAIFNEIKDFAQSSALGNSSTIMAYGATGTGKSYTFLSSDGLVHSFIGLIFDLASQEAGQYAYEFQMTAVEVYLNKVYDLIQSSAGGQKVETKIGFETSVPLTTQEEAFGVIKTAIDRREAASTRQNQTSSRSHFIISVTIVRHSIADGTVTKGTTSFVDLAGSESVGKNNLQSSSSALQIEQGNDINKSLLDLGQSIRSVASGGKFHPGHNLTRYLRTSLSLGSRLLVIATVSPLVSNQNNSLATLRWSTEAVGSTSTKHSGSKSESSRSGRNSSTTPSKSTPPAPATPRGPEGTSSRTGSSSASSSSKPPIVPSRISSSGSSTPARTPDASSTRHHTRPPPSGSAQSPLILRLYDEERPHHRRERPEAGSRDSDRRNGEQ